jgi:OmpA-OmpF porin, OOP family
MLRRIAWSTLLLGLLASPLAAAQEGFFLEARGGSASIDEDEFDDTTTAFQIGGGYRWGGFGIEGGYVSFNDFENEIFDLDVNAELDGWILGVNGRTSFAEQWYISGRLGAFLWSADADTVVCETPNNCARFSADDDATDFYAGVGLGYDFDQAFSVGIAYDYFGADLEGDDIDTVNLDTNVFWVTGEFRFY